MIHGVFKILIIHYKRYSNGEAHGWPTNGRGDLGCFCRGSHQRSSAPGYVRFFDLLFSFSGKLNTGEPSNFINCKDLDASFISKMS